MNSLVRQAIRALFRIGFLRRLSALLKLLCHQEGLVLEILESLSVPLLLFSNTLLDETVLPYMHAYGGYGGHDDSSQELDEPGG
jgi:hypothetical protein